MRTGKGLRVRVPASTANLGSGFDSIGVAFQMYTELELIASDKLEFIWKEKSGELTPFPFSDQENLILRAMKKVCQSLDCKLPALQVIVQSDIPAKRGLGSSASAFVAGLCAMNSWLEGSLSSEELLWLATEEEGHADNVGAALFGGVFIGALDREENKVHYLSQPFPEKWPWLVAIPSYSLSTSSARRLLPEQYSRTDAIYNLSRYGLLTSSILAGDAAGVREGLKDRLHQPYRQSLIPGFAELKKKAEGIGALGFVISGAGPSVLGLFEEADQLDQARQLMEASLSLPPHQIDVRKLNVDQRGVQITRLEN